MRLLVFTIALVIAGCSAHAGLAGFETGGVTPTPGVQCVNFITDKTHTISLGRLGRLRFMEVQLTMANGKMRRECMSFAHGHALRAPLPLEWVMVLGPACLVAFLCGLVMLLRAGLGGEDPASGPAQSREERKDEATLFHHQNPLL